MTAEPFLTTEELAARWGLKCSAIKNHRRRGVGPPYQTTPRLASARGTPRVLYPLSSLIAFEQANNIYPVKP